MLLFCSEKLVMYNMMLSSASESALRTKACKVTIVKFQLFVNNLPPPLPECVDVAVPESQCSSEGPGAGLSTLGLQGG